MNYINSIISILVLLLLVYFTFFVFEGFNTTAAITCESVLDDDANGLTCGERINYLQTAEGGGLTENEAKASVAKEFPDVCEPCAPKAQTTKVTDTLSYFELNNNSKNLINRRENESELINLKKEENKMRSNVEKIIFEADKVIDYINYNMPYFENVKWPQPTTL